MSKIARTIFVKDTVWGKKGEEKEFKWGFAYWLISSGLAFSANDEAKLAHLNLERAKQASEAAQKKAGDLEIAKKIETLNLSFFLQKDDSGHPFGSIGSKEIIEELKKNNLDLEKEQLWKFKPLKALGESLVDVKLSGEISAKLKVTIQ